MTYKAQNVIIILPKGNRRKPERRKMNEDMNMQENARLVLGLRSAGWSEKKSMIFYFTSKLEMNSISRHQIRSRKKGWKKSSPTHKKHTKCMCAI